MIRFIVAIDEKRGFANEHGIPWLGKIPSDTEYYRAKVNDGSLMVIGYGLYRELNDPYPGGINYVATRDVTEKLRDGFATIASPHTFVQQAKQAGKNVWNLGGASVYDTTLDLADELYITQLEGEFGCTKFFPEFKDQFELKEQSEPITENGITFRFQTWTRK